MNDNTENEFQPKKLTSPFDVFSLMREGSLQPGKSKLKTKNEIYVFIKIIHAFNRLHIELENEKGESFVFNSSKFRALECVTVKPEEIRYETWIDPS